MGKISREDNLHVKVGPIGVLGPIRFFWALLLDTRVTYHYIVYLFITLCFLLLLFILHERGINENLEIICQVIFSYVGRAKVV